MRTSVIIKDALLKKAKKEAVQKNTSLSAIIEDALVLAFSIKQKKRKLTYNIPSAGKGGLLPGVDLCDNASVLDSMEDRESC